MITGIPLPLLTIIISSLKATGNSIPGLRLATHSVGEQGCSPRRLGQAGTTRQSDAD
ncbi:MAG: hypothetical protein V7L20_31535 [Nostoc sp.]